jgi:mycofactocin precursor
MAPAPDSAVLEQPAGTNTGTDHSEDMLLVEDLLVEEISIDGMCGVY